MLVPRERLEFDMTRIDITCLKGGAAHGVPERADAVSHLITLGYADKSV